MANVRSWVGLDVHAAKVVACVVDAESREMTVHRLSGESAEVVAFRSGLPRPTRAAYEAGPTGYGLARALAAAGSRGCAIPRARVAGSRIRCRAGLHILMLVHDDANGISTRLEFAENRFTGAFIEAVPAGTCLPPFPAG
jgi:hypothetical protein